MLELREVVAQGLQVARFLAVVELAQQGLAELFQHSDVAILASALGMLVREGGDLLQDLQIAYHPRPDAGPLDFDHDFAAVAHRGAVDLAEGCGGQGLGVEPGERLGDTYTELVGDDLLDLLERKGRDVVLETRQGVQEWLG